MKGKALLGSLFFIWLLLGGCGKNLPAITQEQLTGKHAVLMVTGANVAETETAAVKKALEVWRQTQNISYEWIGDVHELQGTIAEKAEHTPYDYVIVAGNGLAQQALPMASRITDKKWVLLDDDFSVTPVDVTAGHIAYKRTPPTLKTAAWDEWVKSQLALGLPIEWITETSKPIPSSWAPSEEADHIVFTDGGNPWLNQLSLQARQHGAKWIVTYTAVEGAALQRLKSLNIPVVNMAADKLELNWDLILSGILDTILKNESSSGVQYYTNAEAGVVKK